MKIGVQAGRRLGKNPQLELLEVPSVFDEAARACLHKGGANTSSSDGSSRSASWTLLVCSPYCSYIFSPEDNSAFDQSCSPPFKNRVYSSKNSTYNIPLKVVKLDRFSFHRTSNSIPAHLETALSISRCSFVRDISERRAVCGLAEVRPQFRNARRS